MRILIITILFLPFLAGCANTSVLVAETERVSLNVSNPSPLRLRPMEWSVILQDGKPLYALDTEGFENLALNAEDTQNRLKLYDTIIKKYKEFYESPLDK